MEKLKIDWEPWTKGGPNCFIGIAKSQEGYEFQALVILGLGRFQTWQLTYELQKFTRDLSTIQGMQSGIADKQKAFKLAAEIFQCTLYQERRRTAFSNGNSFSKHPLGTTDETASSLF